MKRNKLFKIGIIVYALSAATPWLVSCSDDNKEVFVPGETTAIQAELVNCRTLAGSAIVSDYPQEAIDQFKAELDIIEDILKEGNVSMQEVINMTMHLNKAKERFLNAKMIGIPEAHLIAGWSFNEGTGTSLAGDGTRSLTATLEPGPSAIFATPTLPQFVDEGINKALYFKNGAHLEVANYNPADFLGKQLSIAVWLKPDVIKGGNYIASLNYWNNWKFQLQEQGKAFFTVKTGAGHVDADNEADLSVAPGNWKHVVMVLNLDVNELSFYVNGLLTKEWNTTGKPNLTGSQAPLYVSTSQGQLPLMIGASTTYSEAQAAWDWSGWDTPTSWDHFEGMMDEIKFYNTALLDGQIRWLFNKEIQEMKQ